MDAKALLQERLELFHNAFKFKQNKRVPLYGNFFTWKVLDAGYKLSEVLYDNDLMEKVVVEFHERYNYDIYFDLGTRNPLRIAKEMGRTFHYIGETDETVQVNDYHLLERDEFKEFAANPMGAYFTKVLKNACKPGITLSELKSAMMQFAAFAAFNAKMTARFANEFGIPPLYKGLGGNPFEAFFGTLRGIKGLALDIRKCKDELKEAMDALFELRGAPNLITPVDGTGFVADFFTAFLGHSILSVKQFEELYWPYVKRIVDFAVEHNKTIFVFCESTMLRFAEFFQDIPKGIMLIHIEQDNIFEFRKKLPNIAVAGGMPIDLLGYGTKEQCIDHAKELIDTLGEGFVLSQDKMISYRNDAKRENLLAVNDFARNYQI